MMTSRRCLAVFMVLVLACSLFALHSRAYAADDNVELTAERSGDDLKLTLVAKKAMTITGLQFILQYDESVFTRKSVTGDYSATIEDNAVVLTGTEAVNYTANDEIVVITFTVGSSFEKNTDYTFKLNSSKIFNEDYDVFDWNQSTYSVTYSETEETTTEAETSSEAESTEPSSSETQPSSSETEPSSSETQPSSSETQASSEAESSSDKETTEAVSTEAAETTEAVETTAADETTKDASTDGSTPDSGDDSALTVYLTTASTAALLLGALFVIRRKKAHAE